MNEEEIIKKTKKFVKDKLYGEGTGHDWWHALRVWKTAKEITEKEGGDLFIIELASLLHDIADWKFYDGNTKIGSEKAQTLLENLGVDDKSIKNIKTIKPPQ